MRKNLGLIFTGLIFFALPNFNLLDIMPDFIGAALIMSGLSKMYMYDGNFEDAKRSAKFLLWISVLRLVLCFWTNSGGRRDYLLPFTFIVCVLEAIYMISLFKGLYLGLEYTLMRADSERLVKKTNEAFTMSFIFVIVSRVLEFAPQICEIYAQDAELDLSSGASFKMSMAQMKMYVLGVCLVCSLILGIIYLVLTADAWIRIISDKNYAPFLKEKYQNYLSDFRDEYVASKIEFVYFLFTLSFVFFFDFYIDGINIIPSLPGILLVTGACGYLLGLLSQKKLPLFALSAVTLICSCINYLFMNRVHLGINYLNSVETYNYKEFPFLESKSVVQAAAVLSVLELFLMSVLVLYCISKMTKLFEKEKRTVAIPMLKFLRFPAILTLLSGAVLKVSRTLEGHFATNSAVSDYVKNKMRITSEAEYLGYMENPHILQYERISSLSYTLSFVTVILAIICVLYLFRIRRFTDGEHEKK